MPVYRCDGQNSDAGALKAAQAAIAGGEVVCIPTDTVYGIGADPFNAQAVTRLLTAKSRTRAMPPPVLVADLPTAQTLAARIPGQAQEMMRSYWPGALTLIFPAKETLGWDLGDTNGTVALRMPDHAVALELLRQCGPLAVTSANLTGRPPALSVSQAVAQLGEKVSVYLDAGQAPGGVPSTILKFFSEDPLRVQVIREGALPSDRLLSEFGLERRV